MSESREIELQLEPGGRRLRVAAGTPLAAALEGLPPGEEFAYPCGGARLCGRCRVEFLRGAPPPTDEEKGILAFGDIEAGTRLACCAVLTDDAEVVLPPRVEMPVEHILTRGVKSDVVVDPEVRKYRCDGPPSTIEKPLCDWSRVIESLPPDLRREARPTLEVLRALPRIVSRAEKAGEPVTLTMRDHRAIEVRSGDWASEHYGVAVDLGTTTISAVLVDMDSGAELAAAGCLNPQRAFGHDLISRIGAVQSSPDVLDRLHKGAVDAISGLIGEMCSERELDPAAICSMVLAGNTLMSHLFLRIDPTALGQAPFAGTLRAGVRLEAGRLGLPIHPEAPVHVLPCIGGFIGGDITAGILVTRLMRQPGVSVLVDIGTNGEVVVAKDGALHATSSAAGPSFEGGKISCGMIAGEGAIHRVEFDGEDFRFLTLGDRPVRGVCGSGLIEFFARGVETGLIAMNGRILEPGGAGASSLTAGLAERLRPDGAGPAIAISSSADGREGASITQADVREFQLGKGAVQTAIGMVLEEVGVGLDQIDRFLVAGAFGSRLNAADCMTLGLLPEMPLEKVFFIGNSSLEGARCVLLNRYERRRAERIAETTRFVELAARPEFQERFAMAMMLGPAMEI